MKRILLVFFIAILGTAISFNLRFEFIAFHPFFGSDDADLKVMTWNVHCPQGADNVRQRQIAEVILQEDADIVLLNEFYQDTCVVLDSMLKIKYKYTEEYQSHRKCGDIFYSKWKIGSSGHQSLRELWKARIGKDDEKYPDSLKGKSISAIKATIAVGKDSVMILGCHWTSNSGDGSGIVNGVDSLKKIESFYSRYKEKQEHRTFQAKWTAELINGSECPVIFMGDMNDFGRSLPLDILRCANMQDAWWEGGTGYGCTFHTGWMRLRIDHILHTNDLMLVNIKVIDTNVSDHNPIVACFNLR